MEMEDSEIKYLKGDPRFGGELIDDPNQNYDPNEFSDGVD